MIEGIDLWRAANVMIEGYGDRRVRGLRRAREKLLSDC